MATENLADITLAPAPIGRPKWAHFLWERGLGLDDVVPVLGRSREYIRWLGLPWDHPKRAVPTADEIALIQAWTGGEISAADWTKPGATS